MPNIVENFEAIEEAVMESPRGRWFLAEYASRLRSRETSAIVGQITALEAAVSSNHDAIMSRLAQALAQPTAPAPAAQPASAGLAPRHMKYFKQDEDIFEAAAKTGPAIVKPPQPPEEKKGAKLTITRMGVPTAAPEAAKPDPAPAEAAPAPLAIAETVPAPVIVPQPVLQPMQAEAAAEAPPKRRIVIIRHKPGEEIDVPLQNELAQTG